MNDLVIYYKELEHHTYKQVKVVLKGMQIVTTFPVSQRWTTNMNRRETLEFLDTSKILVHYTDQLSKAQGFLQNSGCSEIPTVSVGSKNDNECQLPDCKTSPVFCKIAFWSVSLQLRDKTRSPRTDVSGGS